MIELAPSILSADFNILGQQIKELEEAGVKWLHIDMMDGDFVPNNVIIKENGEYHIIDWAHATQGNASADAARTFLQFSMQGKKELAEKYMDLFAKESGIEKRNIQRWVPIVAATQLTKGKPEEEEFLRGWVDILDYE